MLAVIQRGSYDLEEELMKLESGEPEIKEMESFRCLLKPKSLEPPASQW